VRDDRNARLLVLHAAQRLPAFVDRPVRDGCSLKTLTQHFVLGYFHRVPLGQSPHRTILALMLTRPAAAGSVTYPLRHALSFLQSGSDRLAGGSF